MASYSQTALQSMSKQHGAAHRPARSEDDREGGGAAVCIRLKALVVGCRPHRCPAHGTGSLPLQPLPQAVLAVQVAAGQLDGFAVRILR